MAIDREKILVSAQKYVEKKKYDRAVVEYQKIVQEDPNDARILLKIGDLQSKMEAYADAIGTYERVGKFYASQGFSLKAIAVYKQIRDLVLRHVPKLEDQYAHITPKLAELYQQLGLTSDALAALDEVATRLQRQSREQEAIDVFHKIVELDPSNPLPHLRLAEALSRAKDIDGAVAEFGLAASQLVKLGRRDDALKVIDRLLHHKADHTHARTAAELYLARGGANDGMQALAKLQICFQANPRDLDTLGLLARAFNQIGQANKAIEVQKETARLARDTGNIVLFQELLAKLQKLAPNDEGVRRLATGSQAPRPSIAPVDDAPKAAPASSARPSAQSEPEEEEDINESEIEEQEQPLELSRPSVATEPDGEIVVESTIEVVEEIAEAPTSAAANAQLTQILSDADSFRRAGFVAKAIETLHIGLEIAPKAMRVHEALRDLLLEAGQTQDAVDELIVIAELYLDSLDGDAAARVLQDALSLEPQNERASTMLHELGYELVDESQPSVTEQDVSSPGTAPMRARFGSYDTEPLPSYDLEEIGPEDVAVRAKSEPSMRTVAVAEPLAHGGAIDDIDDPFGDSPLPRFPLDAGPDSAAAFDLVRDGDDDPAGHTVIAAPSAADLQATAGTPELESALEEAEFFATRGLYDDARAILDEQLARLPNHPLILERLAELDVQERGVQGVSGTRPSPAAGSVEDRAFDIAASLGSEGDRSSGVGVGPTFGAPSEQVDVEDLFMKFKEGVAKQIDVDDAQSHYDLGVAYKEMGLLDDAIREFETSERDATRACVCCSMIGNIHLERGRINEAIDAFMRGLAVPDRTRDQEAALSYEVGAAYEAKKMTRQALEYFQRCARLVPSFRDVQERARRLQKAEPKQSARAAAVGADDEFDRAFEDILGEGKP